MYDDVKSALTKAAQQEFEIEFVCRRNESYWMEYPHRDELQHVS